MVLAAALLIAAAVPTCASGDDVELVNFPVWEDVVREGADLALEMAEAERCREAFRDIHPNADVPAMLRGGLSISKIGSGIQTSLGYPAAGATSCRAPGRIALSEEMMLFFGPEYVAETLIHEIGHLVSCWSSERRRSEENARRVAKTCSRYYTLVFNKWWR